MAKGAEKRTDRFSMRLPATVHARLLRAANADHRSMADVALLAIEKYLNALESVAASKAASILSGASASFGSMQRGAASPSEAVMPTEPKRR